MDSSRAKVTERDEAGRPSRVTGTHLDITERKLAEEALRESEEQYRAVFDNAGIGIDLLDLHGRIVKVNKALLNILGYSEGELRQLTFLDITHPDDVQISKRSLEALMAGEVDSYRLEKRYVRKDGGIVWADLWSSAVRDANGEHAGTVAVIEDITHLKKAEEEREQLRNQLVQAQKMEAIGTMTGGIAHDFRNLLTIINGYTEMILMDKTEDDPIYADLKRILETGLKGADLVQRLLSFTSQTESKLEPMDLNHRIQETKKLMDRSFPKTIEIETNLPDDLGMVNADAGQMDQLLMNLCVNAKDAMPDGGRLRIETRNITVDEDYCRLHLGAKPGRYVLLEVSDTGIGMSKETMDRIFDPFFTTQGLGLPKGNRSGAVCRQGYRGTTWRLDDL